MYENSIVPIHNSTLVIFKLRHESYSLNLLRGMTMIREGK